MSQLDDTFTVEQAIQNKLRQGEFKLKKSTIMLASAKNIFDIYLVATGKIQTF
jgi:hypothetical protein